ncbi:MAG: protein archease [Chloroflexota bacterium]|nr:protein archease [Chloroflexota bacterium]
MDANRPFSGFKEVPHKADIALDVFAPSLPELFINAVMGLYHILGIRKGTLGGDDLGFTLQDIDAESLLVAFLSELLYQVEQGRAAESIQLEIGDNRLKAELDLAPVVSIEREIKAVTYHELKIIKADGAYRTRIVFDL